jgi:hypothetical protein
MLQDVIVTVDKESYTMHGRGMPRSVTRAVRMPGLADTGAQMTLLGPQQLEDLGFSKEDLVPAAMRILTANDNSMGNQGMLYIRLKGRTPDGREVMSLQQAYYCASARNLFISRECLVDLRIIREDFPVMGSAGVIGQVGVSMFHQRGEAEGPGRPQRPTAGPSAQEAEKELLVGGWHPQEGCVEADTMDGDCPCKCPTRTVPPKATEKCPFEPIPANLEKLRQWIGRRYASSSFNCCTNQKLPSVTSSPPLLLFIDKDVTPVAIYRPGTIPLH